MLETISNDCSRQLIFWLENIFFRHFKNKLKFGQGWIRMTLKPSRLLHWSKVPYYWDRNSSRWKTLWKHLIKTSIGSLGKVISDYRINMSQNGCCPHSLQLRSALRKAAEKDQILKIAQRRFVFLHFNALTICLLSIVFNLNLKRGRKL